MEQDEKDRWNHKYSAGAKSSLEADSFLLHAYSEYLGGASAGTALDVAGGTGRHALWLAQRGWTVRLIDVSEAGVELARKNVAASLADQATTISNNQVQAEVLDLRTVRDLGRERYDLVLVIFYLQRELFPALIAALKPGGFLFYKTYTTDQRHFAGGPRDPMHLLHPNELLDAFASLRVLYYHESVREQGIAELVAAKPKNLAADSR
jgi:tellurite methyltransferase